MMNVQNLHTHTSFCDGKNTVEEMINSAINKGMASIGFSGHALTPHDTSYCMSAENTLKYAEEIIIAKDKYADKIKVYLGLEQDYFSSEPTIDTDYIIGSVHYVLKNGEYIPVDESKEILLSAVGRLYNGDVYSFLADYYKLEENVHHKTGCDIVGHIDLPEKFNSDGSLFDRKNPRYISAYKKAVDKLISQGMIFEINSGAISRGYTALPYPHTDILKYIAENNGKITISSDSHDISTIDFWFDKMCSLAKDCGFKEILMFDRGAFKPFDLTHYM